MKKRSKVIFSLIAICVVTIIVAFLIQKNAERNLEGVKCSYLDPMIVDFLAFGVAIFLIVEGTWDIFENMKEPFKYQIPRIIIVAIGFAITTLHIMQFVHK